MLVGHQLVSRPAPQPCGWKDGGGRQMGRQALSMERVAHHPSTGTNCQ